MDIYIFGILVVISLVIYLLSPILLPFVLGVVFAYLLAPLVKRLDHKINSRAVATLIPLSIFMLLLVAILAVGVPFIMDDIAAFMKSLPQYAKWLESALNEGGVLHTFAAKFGVHINKETLQTYLYSYSDHIAKGALTALQKTALSAMAIIDVISLLVVTPLVTFYILHDWPKFVRSCKNLVPSDLKKNATETIKGIDKALSAFIRGQLSVCLALGLFYGTALSIAGLQMGFFVGLLTGILSFIPFIGMGLGLILSTGLALMQYKLAGVEPYLIIASIFILGQVLEGFVLTPKFVGKSTGLHPVWVIFAIMAGGELGGFLGMLIALPLATVLTVILPLAMQTWVKNRVAHKGKAK